MLKQKLLKQKLSKLLRPRMLTRSVLTKELEKEADEYRNSIAVTEILHDSLKERMAREYSYNYDSDTSMYESDTEEGDDRKI